MGNRLNRLGDFVKRRFQGNRSNRRIRSDIQRLHLRKEETRLLIELEYQEVITHHEIQVLLKQMGEAAGTEDEETAHHALAKIMSTVKDLRERMKKELAGIVDKEEIATIRRVFRAKIESVIRGEDEKKKEEKKQA